MDLIAQASDEIGQPKPKVVSISPLEITADGSASPDGGAGAAIVRLHSGKETLRIKVVAKFSCNQGSAAELGAIILGVATARVITELEKIAWPSSITVCADNQGILGGLSTKTTIANGISEGTGKIAHQGLWHLLSSLGNGAEFIPRYLRSAGTNRFQNNCDYAARWVLRDGDKLLAKYGEGPIGRNAKQLCADAWVLLDASPLHNFSEESKGYEQSETSLLDCLRNLELQKCIKKIEIQSSGKG